MSLRMQIGTFRLLALIPLLLAQAYLFLRARSAILSSLRQGRFRYGVIIATGLAMGILSVMNAGPVFSRTTWVEPSWGARTFLFYLPAIWAFGSIFSALLLGLTRAASMLTKTAIRLYRKVPTGRLPPVRTLTAAGSFEQVWFLLPRPLSLIVILYFSWQQSTSENF